MGITKPSPGRFAFLSIDVIVVCLAAFMCLLPIINLIAVSFSSPSSAAAGIVRLWPVKPTIAPYRMVLESSAFWRSFGISLLRIGLALPLTMVVVTLTAYPLSKDSRVMPGRNFYTYFLLVTIMFGGSLIPWYLTMRALRLTNTIWGLVIPTLTPVFNIILLMNFLRGLPKEIEDAAFMDGAGPLQTLWMIIVPLSKPCLATIALFTIVQHWNSWFDGIVLMDSTNRYPLQAYLQSILVKVDPRTIISRNLKSTMAISERTFRAAQVTIAMVPILCAYPFLQKYFTKGIVLGSVKG
jgi:putative aldouronate transport system permease protein